MTFRHTGRALTAFADCIKSMDRVIANGGGTLVFENYAKAVTFRHRCYRVRALLMERAEEARRPGTFASTPYDDLVLHLEKGDNKIVFSLRSAEPPPVFVPPAGDLSLE